MMDEIDVPYHFLCPISMEMMRDPVTVSTGITYDRENIERWLFSCKNNSCPVTKQVLSNTELTPNHTLRRLIQGWCILNASHGIERILTPKPPIEKVQILKLIDEAKKLPNSQLIYLRRLRSIAFENERNKRCLEEAGGVEFLASIVENGNNDITVTEAAVEILSSLKTSETRLKNLLNNDGEFLESLTQVLRRGNFQSRAHITLLVKSIFEVADPIHLISLKLEFFEELGHVLNDQISQQASKAALKILVELCPWGRNRIKAVEGGAVPVLIELLIGSSDHRRFCELVLIVLDQLCGCAEGRAELLKHGAGMAIVSKKILRVSHAASNRAVRILSSLCRFSATSRVLHEMLQLGVVSKLCLVLQVDSNLKTKERAREILKLHSRVWKNSSCIPAYLLSSYPSS
ncbi:hypothetical protein I3843_13G112800 [Carya illinoinensis]|nr:hypothetical protein I3843_13G112800 [Carya illinoinensis]